MIIQYFLGQSQYDRASWQKGLSYSALPGMKIFLSARCRTVSQGYMAKDMCLVERWGKTGVNKTPLHTKKTTTKKKTERQTCLLIIRNESEWKAVEMCCECSSHWGKQSVIKHDMMIKCHHKIKRTSERRSIFDNMSNNEMNNLQNYN